METLVALALCVGLSNAAYDPFAERSYYPPDPVLKAWDKNNSDYMWKLVDWRQQLEDPLRTLRPDDDERDEMLEWIREELQEVERIHWIIYYIRNIDSNPLPPTRQQLWEWFRLARPKQRPWERAARYIPWGGYPEPGWRERLK